MLQSIAGLIQHSNVAVSYFPATEVHPPLRIFYPFLSGSETSATAANKLQPYQWLEENGVFYYLYGNVRLVCGRTVSWLLVPLIQFVSLILPVRWRNIPNVYSIDIDSVCDNNGDGGSNSILPLCSLFENNSQNNNLKAIVFSHGLTGTGQEHAAMLAAWASLGYLVVSVHHTDGSSSRVRLLEQQVDLWYKQGPPFSHYDANFRPRQLEHRCQDILQACEFVEKLFLCSNHETNKQTNTTTNDSITWLVAGYSYGAATAARVADERLFHAAILLDGWFYIDVSELAGIEFRFPEQAFSTESGLRRIPARIFVNSQQFADMPKLYQATCDLAGVTGSSTPSSSRNNEDESNQSWSKMHVVQNTAHLNFCEVIYWAPMWLWRRLLGAQLGTADPISAYEELVETTCQFLRKNFGEAETK